MAAQNRLVARRMLRLSMQGNIEAYLACCQLGITMASLGLRLCSANPSPMSALLDARYRHLRSACRERTLHFISFTGFLIFSSLHIVIGEQVPKTLPIRQPMPVSQWIAYPLYLSYLVFYPLNWLLNAASRGICAPARRQDRRTTKSCRRSELAGRWSNLLHARRQVESGEAEYIGNVFSTSRDLAVSDVMVHRTAMVMINADLPPEELVREVLATEYTRIPLWREKPENIIGVLHAKDLLRAIRASDGDTSQIDVTAITLPPWFVPEMRPLSEQLKAFRRRKTHFALVVDEYGEVEGMVTLEDILEEIVGDISDEHDVVVAGVRVQPRRLGGGGRLGADPRPQPRHGLASAGRGGDHRRRPRHPRGALDPRTRPELHLLRLPLPRAAP